ncbi:MAG: hypothetical protein KZQ97_20660 [Candidatus Thiodiazotropha sp. (ex Dulcina madagascariensis)]|nr:hypothetical protein [Candidatus Thiodiazotropha sp. (ex Dulcina madagascariensis)]
MDRITIFLAMLLSVFSSVSLAAWDAYWVKHTLTNDRGQSVNVFRYRTPSSTSQVVVLNGGLGTVNEGQIEQYNYMGDYFARRGRQVVVLGFDYYGSFGHDTRTAAQNTGDTIRSVMDANLINQGFWLYSTAGGSLMASGMLDYNLTDSKYGTRLVDVCDRVIFISGPAHGITRNDIENSAILNLMISKGVWSLDSLDEGLSYAQRQTNWIITLLQKNNGIRFVYAADDNVYCANPLVPCASPSMPEAVNDWVLNLTDGQYTAQGLTNYGLLKVLPSGGHDPLLVRPDEILNFVSN